MHPVLKTEFQFKVKDCPTATDVGVTVRVALGAELSTTTMSQFMLPVWPTASVMLNENLYSPVCVASPVIAPVELTEIPGGNCPVMVNNWGCTPRASGGI